MNLSLLENPADKGAKHFGNGGNSLLYLCSSPCTLTLGVGDLDVDSSFWEFESFLNGEANEPLILGARERKTEFLMRSERKVERLEEEKL